MKHGRMIHPLCTLLGIPTSGTLYSLSLSLNSRSDPCVSSRGGAYQAPPSLGNTTNPNEISLASLGGALPGMGGGAPSAEIIDAHLAVQGTIRSYQVNTDQVSPEKYYNSSLLQVRGHLAAQIDPLGLNNMEREKAKKMIIRSVTVDQKVHS